MGKQSAGFNEYADGLLDGDSSLGSFARTAMSEIAKVETPVRYPTSRKAWPPEVWAEMERIRKGEQP